MKLHLVFIWFPIRIFVTHEGVLSVRKLLRAESPPRFCEILKSLKVDNPMANEDRFALRQMPEAKRFESSPATRSKQWPLPGALRRNL